jgi:hypothetical protein
VKSVVRNSLRRPALVVAVVLATAGGLLAAGPAEAQSVEYGTFAVSGDEGDWTTGGRSYSYATDVGDVMAVSSSESVVHVSVSGSNGDSWWLDLAAPAGQPLVPGTYTGAVHYPYNSISPAMDLHGDGPHCLEVTGSFTISNAVYGPYGYVEAFDATFEQHCGDATAAARGEVHIANPAAEPVLALGVTVATDGTVSTVNGNATVHGTVTCNKATDVYVSGTLTQVVKKNLVRGALTVELTCTPGGSVAWTTEAIPSGTIPFDKGEAEARISAQGYDSTYGQYTQVDDTTTVALDKN